MTPPRDSSRAPPYLSALHLLIPVEGWSPQAQDPTPHPRPLCSDGQAVRGQGWGSGNPLPALGEKARAKDLSKQRSQGAGGPSTGVLSHPATTIGRRFTGNRKMCTSHCWNRRRELRRKGVGEGRRSPKGCLSIGVEATLEHGPDSCSGLDSCPVHTHLPH